MNRKRVVSTVILFALAMLNTGCIQKYFNDTENRENKVENKKRIEVKALHGF